MRFVLVVFLVIASSAFAYNLQHDLDTLNNDLAILRGEAHHNIDNEAFLSTGASTTYVRFPSPKVDIYTMDADEVKKVLFPWIISRMKKRVPNIAEGQNLQIIPMTTNEVELNPSKQTKAVMEKLFGSMNGEKIAHVVRELPYGTRDALLEQYNYVLGNNRDRMNILRDITGFLNSLKAIEKREHDSQYLASIVRLPTDEMVKWARETSDKERGVILADIKARYAAVTEDEFNAFVNRGKDADTKMVATDTKALIERYKYFEPADIYKGLYDLCSAETVPKQEANARAIVEVFRVIASTENYGARALAKFEKGLKMALSTKKCPMIYMLEAAEGARKVPGHEYVKTWLLYASLSFYKPGAVANFANNFIKTDPVPMFKSLAGSSLVGVGLLNKLFSAFCLNDKISPQVAAESISDILADAASKIAISAASKEGWRSPRALSAFHGASHSLGVAAGALQMGIKARADMARKLIKEGGMLLKLITKTINAVAGKIPLVSKVTGLIDDGIDKLQKSEEAAVKDWENQLTAFVSQLMDRTFAAAKSKLTRDEFHDIQVEFEVYYLAGNDKAHRFPVVSDDSDDLTSTALKWIDNNISKGLSYLPSDDARVKLPTEEEQKEAEEKAREEKRKKDENVLKY